MTSLFFKDKLITIPEEYSHKIEKIDKDVFHRLFDKVVLSCYFTGKKDPIHHENLKDKHRIIDDYKYMRPLYESCKKLKLHLIIFHDNLSKKFIDKYSTDRIIFRQVNLTSKISINDERFIIYYEYLLKHPYEYVFSSDISDVFILKDPFRIFKYFSKRPDIDQNIVETILSTDKIKDNLSLSPYQPKLTGGEKLTEEEAKRFVIGLREVNPNDYSVENLIFIGTNSIDNGPKIKTKEWFILRKDKIKAFNDALKMHIPKYKLYKAGDFQIYNPGTILANFNSYMCFIKRFIKLLLVSCKIREQNNWNMVLANYICHNFLKDDYNPDTYHSKYIYTGFPFNSIYQRKEDLDKCLAYIVHK